MQIQTTDSASSELLLSQARASWQNGDWQSLAELPASAIQSHPDRARLALMAAVSQNQLGRYDAARRFATLAQDWGCDRRLIARALIGGAHNSLARAAAAAGDDVRATAHFAAAVQSNGGDSDVVALVRAVRELSRAGLFHQAIGQLAAGRQAAALEVPSSKTEARLKALGCELELLQHELSIALRRGQLYRSADDGVPSDDPRPEKLEAQSVSQLGQDLWVIRMLNYRRGGFFVDFGATDGVLLSNTWLLEQKFGWSGICSEPNPEYFEQLKKNRTCICRNVCISDTDDKEVEFILAGAYGTISAFESSDMHAEKRRAYRELGSTTRFRTQTLNTFLGNCGAPRDIDYLSIDTEGSELDILKEFDLKYWRVKMMTVEHNFVEPNRTQLRSLLQSYGYKVQEAEWDDWYWHPELLGEASTMSIN
jgi:FkbM family methyltransferase